VGAQDPQAPQPTFRARVDLIQVDVSVLGRDRHPVSGLTAADFTLMEDGRPRPIVSFTEVHVPPPAALTAGWMADIAPDVTTNTQPPRRLVVIAIDDGALSTNGGLWGVQKARAAARAAVKELGPDDLAALVLTRRARGSSIPRFSRRAARSIIDSICRAISRRASTSSPWTSLPTARRQSGRSASGYDDLAVKTPAGPRGDASIRRLDEHGPMH
jgi:hypothetical protein